MMNDIDLMKLVIEVDDELIAEGKQPFQRPFHANLKIGKRLQLGSRDICNDSFSIKIQQIYGDLYRSTDLHMPPMHIGAFMFRDVFFPLRISIIYGSPIIDPIKFLDDITDKQLEWLFSNQQSSLKFLDQVIDLMDFVYGFHDIGAGQVPDKTLVWWHKAKQQLEAAAATVLGSFDKDAVIQNCCIATELLLKGALMAKGITEKELASKQYGHNLENLVNKTAEQLPTFDKETVLFVVNKFPNYVKSRYESEKFSRLELGNFLMNTQFISGEILRQFSERNFRADFIEDDNFDLTKRTFPKQRPAL
jgi:HEPN domain-containing protein